MLFFELPKELTCFATLLENIGTDVLYFSTNLNYLSGI